MSEPQGTASLPPAWRMARAGDVADIRLGKMLDRAKHTEGTALPYLRNINVRWERFETSDMLEMFFAPHEVERYRVLPGDLVVCEGGEPGRAAIWRGAKPVMYQKALHRVRPGPDVTAEWLLVCLKHYAVSGSIQQYVSGTTIKHFTREAFGELPVPLPPLDEQRRIVARLEALMERSRRARAELAEIPTQLVQARQSLLAAAFRTGSETWKQTTVGEVSESIRYGFTASAEKAPTDTRFLRITDIQDGRVDWGSVPFVSVTAKEAHQYLLQRDDLVFARTGATTGKSYLLEECPRAVFASYLIRVRASELVLPKFLALFFQSPIYWHQVSENVAGVAQPSCNASKLESIRLPLPPLDEQREIVRRLDAALSRLDKVAAVHASAVAELDRLDQTLLARAFSGRLVSQSVVVATAVPGRAAAPPTLKPKSYLTQLVPALLRAHGLPLALDQINSALALLHSPRAARDQVFRELGAVEALEHFAGWSQAHEDAALTAAVNDLLRTGTLSQTKDRQGSITLHLAGKLPPILPHVEADARHLATFIERIPAPAPDSAPAARTRTPAPGPRARGQARLKLQTPV